MRKGSKKKWGKKWGKWGKFCPEKKTLSGEVEKSKDCKQGQNLPHLPQNFFGKKKVPKVAWPSQTRLLFI